MTPAAAIAVLLLSAAPPRHVTVIYAADLGGWLEPCGCSASQRGGLARAATALARIRKENPDTVFLAGGDLLFAGPLDPERKEQDLAAARTMAEALRAMGLAASWPGERDLAAGKRFLEATGLPFTRSKRIGAVGFGGLGSVPRAPVRVAVVHEGGSRAALARADEARREGVDLLLAAHREGLLDDDASRAVLDAPVPVVQVQGRGQALARIDFFLQGDARQGFLVLPGPTQRAEELELLAGRRAEYARRRAAAEAAGNGALAAALSGKQDELAGREVALRAEPPPVPPAGRPSMQISFVPLGDDVAEDPAVRRILTRHYGAIARANLAAAKAAGRPCPDPARDAPSFIGVDEVPPGGTRDCKNCHPGAYAIVGADAARLRLRNAGEGRAAVRPRLHLLPRDGLEAPRRSLRRGHDRRAPRRAVRGLPRPGQPPRRRPACPHRARPAHLHLHGVPHPGALHGLRAGELPEPRRRARSRRGPAVTRPSLTWQEGSTPVRLGRRRTLLTGHESR